jgi:hypothetical protein
MNFRFFPSLALLLLASMMFYSSCKKTGEPATGVGIEDKDAVFSTVTTDENCDLVSPSGNYEAGTALSTSEKLTIEVDVTRKGEYAFTTDTVNNFYFAANGSFTTLGVQQIVLQGSGTPTQIGTFRFSLPGSKLHFSVQVSGDEQLPTESVPAGVYIKGTLGDYVIDMDFPTATGDGGWGYGGADTVLFMSLIGYGLAPNNPPGTGDIELRKQFMNGFYGSTKEQFKSFFAPQTYPIAFAKCDTHRSNGFVVTWRGHDGVAWSTRKDYDQSGSYVRIVGIEDGHRTDGQYFVKTRTQIKCKMYRFSDDFMSEMNVEMVSYFVRPGP